MKNSGASIRKLSMSGMILVSALIPGMVDITLPSKAQATSSKSLVIDEKFGGGFIAMPGKPEEYLRNSDATQNKNKAFTFTTVESGHQADPQQNTHSAKELMSLSGKADVHNHTVVMSSLKKVDTDNNTFKIDLTKGTVKDGALDGKDFEVSGLPHGLKAAAVGDAKHNSVLFTIEGAADRKVRKNSSLRVVLHASASNYLYKKTDHTIDGIKMIAHRFKHYHGHSGGKRYSGKEEYQSRGSMLSWFSNLSVFPYCNSAS